ncbi:hypothetical protein M408DRAFT_23122 [Serendipita vermifera MAFF 305830]|uniref:Uncharacterized protein n=1 Tax=Serendipita vermifera MAFF 305830 TaxID=933852 RepID=A0A0C2WT86_SERVB|nr:hypothetical protein M408DRAFT_23122 [Serendipita vermifera MAFF 305830]
MRRNIAVNPSNGKGNPHHTPKRGTKSRPVVPVAVNDDDPGTPESPVRRSPRKIGQKHLPNPLVTGTTLPVTYIPLGVAPAPWNMRPKTRSAGGLAKAKEKQTGGGKQVKFTAGKHQTKGKGALPNEQNPADSNSILTLEEQLLDKQSNNAMEDVEESQKDGTFEEDENGEAFSHRLQMQNREESEEECGPDLESYPETPLPRQTNPMRRFTSQDLSPVNPRQQNMSRTAADLGRSRAPRYVELDSDCDQPAKGPSTSAQARQASSRNSAQLLQHSTPTNAQVSSHDNAQPRPRPHSAPINTQTSSHENTQPRPHPTHINARAHQTSSHDNAQPRPRSDHINARTSSHENTQPRPRSAHIDARAHQTSSHENTQPRPRSAHIDARAHQTSLHHPQPPHEGSDNDRRRRLSATDLSGEDVSVDRVKKRRKTPSNQALQMIRLGHGEEDESEGDQTDGSMQVAAPRRRNNNKAPNPNHLGYYEGETRCTTPKVTYEHTP